MPHNSIVSQEIDLNEMPTRTLTNMAFTICILTFKNVR